ncbi:MAG TPA: helix-turn-helix domain-containing protein [Polyangiaceae bacterium]|nr:helix-turn-helix domain-containing protein [Polyangiaceae bacterium]
MLAPELPRAGLDLDRWLERAAWSLIDQAMEMTGGNKNQAARLLGLNRTTLVERLKRYRHPSSLP